VKDLKYPVVDLFTDAIMPLTYLNILTAGYLLLLTALWLFMQAWMKGLALVRVRRSYSIRLTGRLLQPSLGALASSSQSWAIRSIRLESGSVSSSATCDCSHTTQNAVANAN
jgi:hypothetical protein